MTAGDSPTGPAVREALAWFEEDPRRLRCLDSATALAIDLQHAATIVRAVLGTESWELLRQVDEIRLLRVESWEEDNRDHIAGAVERIALTAGARDVPAPAGLLTLDELTAAVENAFECAAIEVVVWETDDTGARDFESSASLYRLTRCLRSYGLLDERRDRGEDAGDDLAAAAGALISHTAATGSVPARTSGLWTRLERAAKSWRSQR